MKNASALTLIKMSGAGNTFALIDARNESVYKTQERNLNLSRAELTKHICDDVVGIHTDGVLFIEDGSEGFDFNWDFFNSDGSSAEMCGNAARCAARFCAETLGSKREEIKFKTGAGLVTARALAERRVQVTMPEAKVLKDPLALKTHTDADETFTFVNTGVPHLVQKIHTMADAENLKEMAREARGHKDLSPSGANVTFYAETGARQIDAITFERGVEDYTLACGTGAVAAALVYARKNSFNDVEVQMPGGLLQVQFVDGDPRPRMTGQAIFIGTFSYNLEGLR